MSYFPMYIELQNEKCLVVGGGNVAYRKVCALLEFGARITVIAKRIDEDFKKFEEQITCIEGEIDEAILHDGNIIKVLGTNDNVIEVSNIVINIEEYRLVIAATDDVYMNHMIAELCKSKNIPINAVDQQEDCTFIFPSYYKAGKLTMALTTSGSSPYYAAKLREKLQKEIPDMTEELLEQMSLVRSLVKERISDSAKRGALLKQMVLFAMEQNRILTEKEINDFLENRNETFGDRN